MSIATNDNWRPCFVLAISLFWDENLNNRDKINLNIFFRDNFVLGIKIKKLICRNRIHVVIVVVVAPPPRISSGSHFSTRTKANLDSHYWINSVASKVFFHRLVVLCYYLITVKKVISVMCL